MLYSLYEAQHMALVPMRFLAELTRGWFGHPFSPFAHHPLSRRFAASSDLFLRVTDRYEKPKWDLDEAQSEIVVQKPFCNLIRFRVGAPKLRKVLVVAPLSGHHATLVRETVRALLAEHDVWVSDWVDARMVPLTAGPFHLDDYVDYVRDWITVLSPDVHLISVCQPTVPVLAAVALMAANGGPQPRSMTMMGGPIDARRSPTAVNNLAQKKTFLLVPAEPDSPRAAEVSGLHAAGLPRFPPAHGIRGDEPRPASGRSLGLLPSSRAGGRRLGRNAPALLR